jgi:hypothetical protein
VGQNRDMKFEEIKIDQIEKIIEENIFYNSFGSKFHLVPSSLFQWADQSGFRIKIEEIDDWEEFEYDHIDFDEEQFKKLAFKRRIYSSNSSVIFISDDCLKQGACFKFELNEFDRFVDYYESKFPGSFFQPLDYIIILCDYKEIVIIYHEGKLVNIYK